MNGIEETLKTEKIFMGKTQGDSMEPMLSADKDTVFIIPPFFPLQKYDVPVYRRDGHYTMHRIVKTTKKGYIICGDNRTYLEKDITDKDIVGILVAFYHNGRFIQCSDEEYIKYSKRICRNLPIRRLKSFLRRILNKIKSSINN